MSEPGSFDDLCRAVSECPVDEAVGTGLVDLILAAQRFVQSESAVRAELCAAADDAINWSYRKSQAYHAQRAMRLIHALRAFMNVNGERAS